MGLSVAPRADVSTRLFDVRPLEPGFVTRGTSMLVHRLYENGVTGPFAICGVTLCAKAPDDWRERRATWDYRKCQWCWDGV